MNKDGFTFIELVIVLAIMSIVLAIAIPKNTFPLSLKERKELRELKRDIVYARNMSITNAIPYSIDFFVTNNSYKINRHEQNDVLIKNKILESGLKLKEVNWGDSTQYNRLYFAANGTPRKAGTILLNNSKKQKIEITVEVATGKVNIYFEGEKVK